MVGSVLYVALVALGVDAGWQPLPDGGLEYIIQIEPHLLGQLRQNEEIISDLDPEAKGVRSVRIRVGTGDLPRRSLPAPAGGSWTLPEDGSVLKQAGPILDPFRRPEHPPGGQGAQSRPEQPKQSDQLHSNSPAGFAPKPLNLDPGTKPIDSQPASFLQETPPGTPPDADSSEPQATGNTPPPFAWMVTLGALVASTGGMLYFGWVAWDYRSRYRRLLDRLFEGNRQPWLSDVDDSTTTG